MTTNHPAHGHVSLDRLHQIRETLSKAAEQSDGGNLGYAMADAVKVIDWALERCKADATPEFHTEASRFLPECLKAEEISGERRNSRIAELMGWFDRYYSGNANPKWFKPHAAELCYYILTAPPTAVVPDERETFEAFMEKRFGDIVDQRRAKNGDQGYMAWDMAVAWIVWQHCAAMLQAGNSPVIGIDLASEPDRSVEVRYFAPPGYVMVPKELTCEMDDAAWQAYHETRSMSDIWAALLSAAPQQEVKS